MIYNFLIRNENNEDKQFYLTADNHSQLFKRIQSTYGVSKDKVSILEEYEETPDYGYKLHKSYIGALSEEDKEVMQKAKLIFSQQTKKCNPWKTDYITKHHLQCVNISEEKDIYDLVRKYKFVKVYWELGEQRGNHSYYAVYK